MSHSLAMSLAHLLLTGLSVFIVAKLLPGVRTNSFGAAVAFAFVVGILNAIVWGFFLPLTAAFSIVTLGIGVLIVNGLVFLLAARVVGGVQISGCFVAAIASVAVTLINGAIHALFGVAAP